VGHWRICQPQVPSAAAAHTGPPVEPSAQMKFGAPGAGPAHTHADPASSTTGHAGKSQPHLPLASLLHTLRPTDVPPGQTFASAGAGRPAQSAGVQSDPPSALVPEPLGTTAPLHPLAPANSGIASSESIFT
jgi:hypothetical protein